MEDRSARIINLALGIWLLVSAFIWRHEAAQHVITFVTGIAMALVALLALRTPRTRFINVVLGAWLIISAFAFPHQTMGTVWNSVFVGVIVGYVALMGPGVTSPRTSRPV